MESDDESSTGSSHITTLPSVNDLIPIATYDFTQPSINRFRCGDCNGTFRTAQDLSWHQTQYTMCTITRAMRRENIIPFQTFTPTTTPPPMHGNGNYNRRFLPYMRPTQEVPIFPRTHDNNNINESSGRTMDLISLMDKPIDSVPLEELPGFENGSTRDNNNDIDLELKL